MSSRKHRLSIKHTIGWNLFQKKEFEGIARSIAKWKWRKFVGRARDDCDRGAYRRISAIHDNDIKERKQVARRRTAEIRLSGHWSASWKLARRP